MGFGAAASILAQGLAGKKSSAPAAAPAPKGCSGEKGESPAVESPSGDKPTAPCPAAGGPAQAASEQALASAHSAPTVQRGPEDELAAGAFDQFVLASDELDAVTAAREAREAPPLTESVIATESLRSAFLAMGDEVESKHLFSLAQDADPDAEGVVALEQFLRVARIRRAWLEQQKRQRLLIEAYTAIGGSTDQEKKVPSKCLLAVTADFLDAGAADAAIRAVTGERRKAVQAVLDMGGALDSDEEEELNDTSLLTFDEMRVFSEALRAPPADSIAEEGDDADGGEEGDGRGDSEGASEGASGARICEASR